MCKALKKFWKSAKALLLNNLPRIIGGITGFMIFYILTPASSTDVVINLLKRSLGLVIGVLIAENIVFLIRNKRIYPIVKTIRNIINQAAKKEKVNYEIEKKLLEDEIKDTIYIHSQLYTATGNNLTLYKYERLIKTILEKGIFLSSGQNSILGTCLILPNKFEESGEYAEMWYNLKYTYDQLNYSLKRILCDHNKTNLLNSIKDHKQKFVNFCTWNHQTKFELYVFGGKYDIARRNSNLPYNDFVIMNNSIVVGGYITQQEKMRRKKNLGGMIITKSSIDENQIERYAKLFNQIIDNSRLCKKVKVEDPSNAYSETVDFLENI